MAPEVLRSRHALVRCSRGVPRSRLQGRVNEAGTRSRRGCCPHFVHLSVPYRWVLPHGHSPRHSQSLPQGAGRGFAGCAECSPRVGTHCSSLHSMTSPADTSLAYHPLESLFAWRVAERARVTRRVRLSRLVRGPPVALLRYSGSVDHSIPPRTSFGLRATHVTHLVSGSVRIAGTHHNESRASGAVPDGSQGRVLFVGVVWLSVAALDELTVALLHWFIAGCAHGFIAGCLHCCTVSAASDDATARHHSRRAWPPFCGLLGYPLWLRVRLDIEGRG